VLSACAPANAARMHAVSPRLNGTNESPPQWEMVESATGSRRAASVRYSPSAPKVSGLPIHAAATGRTGDLPFLAQDLGDRCECEPFGAEVGDDLRKDRRGLRAAAMGQDDAAVHRPPIHVGAHLLG
jgi:hypothetical protein